MLGVSNARQYAECPHEGSARRPDMGIRRHSWTSALLIQELAR
jgi:hypothetical protein